MMLFESKERHSHDPKSYGETNWEYLDRSGRNVAENVRSFLNKWIMEYPESERGELISRISNSNDRNFHSATFELVLFALLKSLGCSLTVHPELEGGNRRHPDFLITTPESESVYIEAVLASEFSEADIKAQKRTKVVLDAIQKIESPNFFISVDPEGHPERPPNGKILRKELERWVASLDPDTVAHDVLSKGNDEIPKMKWAHEGWSINFEAIPIRAESRGKGQRVIGALWEEARWLNIWEPIRDAVKAKGNRYGTLPYPLLVCINIDALSVDRIDEMQGLFGQEEIVLSEIRAAKPQLRRKPNGAWYSQNGPQYTRVSGAWIFANLNSWNIVTRKNTVYFNPWATKPLPSLFTAVNHAKVEDTRMGFHNGRKLGEILNLPDKWPE